jgi:DNA-binding transcriptional regulator YiaG
VATSAVWKPACSRYETNGDPVEKPAGKKPGTAKTAETAFSANPANVEKSIGYDIKNVQINTETAEPTKAAFPAKTAETANTGLHELRIKYDLTAERIAKITGRNKIETVLQWLNNEKEIPEKALRELRKWTRMKNKVVSIKEAPYGI